MKHTHTNKNWNMWDSGIAGGNPIWLNPSKIPSKYRLVCGSCNTKMLFLLQLYVPIDDEINHKNAFHRIIYVFCCKNENAIQLVALMDSMPLDHNCHVKICFILSMN